jgi:putative aminopeptidase FrvX
MMMSRSALARVSLASVACWLSWPVAIAAAQGDVAARTRAASYADAVAEWIALPAATGHERSAMDVITTSMPGWTTDRAGNLVARHGTGPPRRVIACGLDEAAFVVSEITDDGYIRLHVDGHARRSPLWDQSHEGQRVRILSRAGDHPAVVAVRSTHLWRARPAGETLISVDDLWVDVGARSRAEVTRLGIAVLDPVIREWPPWRMADVVVGPGAGDRASCAALAATARRTPSRGETIWVISVRHAFGYEGLAAALAQIGPVDSLFLLDPTIARDTSAGAAGMARHPLTNPVEAPWIGGRGITAVAIGLPTRFPGSLAESVRGADIVALVDEAARLAGVFTDADTRMPSGPPSFALHGVPRPPAAAPVTDSLTPVATLLGHLSDIYSVSGQEDAMRAAVRQALPPSWQREKIRVDTAGDLIVEAGPDRDTTVIIAHLDEIGFRITRIGADGAATLAQLGGFYPSLWEGQPALLHLTATSKPRQDCALLPTAGAQAAGMPVVPGTLAGLFVPRDHATSKQPDSLTVWTGVDSAGLVACGIAPGVRVSGYKLASRAGDLRFTARSIDDRAGCTALLLALRSLDPHALKHKVIFVWSVREEVGLDGAAVVARSLGTSVHRVHAIDTFVSSDSPLESHLFAYAPLGDGAALRALDNSSVTPAAEIDRVVALAAAGGIPLQVGTTNGGNDGSTFVPWGAVNVPIGWPLRYSHSPAELVDLRDINALARMVAAVATGP